MVVLSTRLTETSQQKLKTAEERLPPEMWFYLWYSIDRPLYLSVLLYEDEAIILCEYNIFLNPRLISLEYLEAYLEDRCVCFHHEEWRPTKTI